ncbi:hypothetical protein MBLNU457_3792t1 [Dothideomycetes sp. NU457]
MTSTRLTRLLSLQSKQLKTLALLTGSTSASTKTSIAEHLHHGVCALSRPSTRQRILSVDMGIKNLAFCVIEPEENASEKPVYKLVDWKRLNLLAPTVPTIDGDLSETDSSTTKTEAEVTEAEDGASTPPTEDTKPFFTPSKIAPLAFQLSQTLLKYNPTTILIERQRFRSARGSAVQEWTLRVNMLEAMLWACFETSGAIAETRGHARDFDVKEMNPSRIAAFWNSKPDMVGHVEAVVKGNAVPEQTEVKEKTTRGMEKKEKIKLVKKWLEDSVVVGTPEVRDVVAGFDDSQGRRRGEGVGKKDDFADCLVQGVTAAIWQSNLLALRDVLDDDVEVRAAKPKPKAKPAGRTKKVKS